MTKVIILAYALLSYFILGFAASEDCFEQGIDYLGNDISEGHYVSTSSAAGCQSECQRNSACNFWTWDPSYHTACWMKTAKTQTAANSVVTSGPKYCDGEQTTSDPGGDYDSMRVMSYNLYGWNALVQNPWKAENVYKAIRQVNPDILGAQECEGREYDVAANIGSDYTVAGSSNAGHAILYKTSVFTFEGHGYVQLNEMDQFGPRTVEYAHLTHRLSGRQVDFFNTHLCLCNGEQLLGSAVTIEDTFRSYNGAGADGTTFPGKPGKIDYVLVDKGAMVKNAWIDRNWDDQGKASDHWPVSAVVDLLN